MDKSCGRGGRISLKLYKDLSGNLSKKVKILSHGFKKFLAQKKVCEGGGLILGNAKENLNCFKVGQKLTIKGAYNWDFTIYKRQKNTNIAKYDVFLCQILVNI